MEHKERVAQIQSFLKSLDFDEFEWDGEEGTFFMAKTDKIPRTRFGASSFQQDSPPGNILSDLNLVLAGKMCFRVVKES